MSRSDHSLRCTSWWGRFAQWFHSENRRMRHAYRRHRARMERRVSMEGYE